MKAVFRKLVGRRTYWFLCIEYRLLHAFKSNSRVINFVLDLRLAGKGCNLDTDVAKTVK